jgi:8-oxo-dGTP diphosphatase
MAHAVKAIINRSDDCILLQQRDHTPGLSFPGCWTFFGGQVETDESLEDALKRELIEELGCVPGPVGDELFKWEWRGEHPTQNHYFPVYCEVDDNILVLNEGQAMSWFSVDELQRIQLTPCVYENLPQITSFASRSTYPTSMNSDPLCQNKKK